MNIMRNEDLHGLIGVFSSAAFCSYSWSIIIFFWNLSSFLLQWSASDIVGYVAYQLTFALAESLMVTFFIAALGLIVPQKYLRRNIRVSGAALVAGFAVNSIIFKERYALIYALAGMFSTNNFAASQIVINVWVACLIILPVGFVMITRNKKIEKMISSFVGNLSILVVPYVLLSLIGILLVVSRNIF